MPEKLITVFGATGAQGSSVLHSLSRNLSAPFALRGITRNPSSASAQKLSSTGIEVVKADGWDKPSMVAAFKGSWGAFVNTNTDDAVFENPEETRTELDLGKLIVDAAVEAGVEVFVYSGFNSAKEISKGKVENRAFDEKHAIGEYAKTTGAFRAVIIASPGWPLFGGFPIIPSDDGTFVFRVPRWGGKENVPFIAIGEDYGDIVHGIFLEPERWNGKLVQGVSDIESFDQVMAAFESATGKKARFEEVPKWQDLEIYGIRALEAIKLMFGFCQESGGRYYGDETEASTAAELKKKATEASGKTGDDTKLFTLKSFFKRELGGK
ncbi:hypothetical protein BKA66DRAFT_575365 [Pyrenochaeta sp. MPI-SDFR-AT-0127]|nr:hypothetical protein BKA66DRAFT_575365 [Pyrenochaeta sp. MPI-SDFR-AT-0127]